jgi:hypothetical protein
MKRTNFNLLIDALAAILLGGVIITGYILYFALPPGTNKSLSLWGMTRHEWGRIHAWISFGLLIVLLTHVVLHLQWVVAMIAQRLGLPKHPSGPQKSSGFATLLILAASLSLLAWWIQISVRELDEPFCPAAENSSGASAADSVDFWKQVYPIIGSACVPCHNAGNPRGNFRADHREDYFDRNGQVALVVAGKSAESPLIEIVSGLRKDMALAAHHKLPDRDVAMLRAWIDAGAVWPKSAESKR